MRDTFIIRSDWKDAIEQLTPELQAIIFMNLFYYHSEEITKINLNNLQVKLVWSLIEPQLRYNIGEYDRRRETSRENGMKGGRPQNNLKKPNNNLNNQQVNLDKPNKPNETLYVYDYVNDNVYDNDNVLGENVQKNFAVEMAQIFYDENPDYPKNKNLDLRPAREIFDFLKSQGHENDKIFNLWRQIASLRADNPFYKDKPLKIISSQIQGLYEAVMKPKEKNSKTKAFVNFTKID